MKSRVNDDMHRVLLTAFPTRDGVAQLVRFVLDENLDAIAHQGPLSATMFSLLQWAEAQGRLDDLIAGAIRRNPENQDLRQLALTGRLLEPEGKAAETSSFTDEHTPEPAPLPEAHVP